MSKKVKIPNINQRIFRKSNPKAEKAIKKKKRKPRMDRYMFFYMRYIRADNDKKELKAKIE